MRSVTAASVVAILLAVALPLTEARGCWKDRESAECQAQKELWRSNKERCGKETGFSTEGRRWCELPKDKAELSKAGGFIVCFWNAMNLTENGRLREWKGPNCSEEAESLGTAADAAGGDADAPEDNANDVAARRNRWREGFRKMMCEDLRDYRQCTKDTEPTMEGVTGAAMLAQHKCFCDMRQKWRTRWQQWKSKKGASE